MRRELELFHVQSGSENKVLKNVKKVDRIELAYISAMKNMVET